MRDYVHVSDVVAAYLLLGMADVAPGEAFNLSAGERFTVLEVVERIRDAVGCDVEPVIQATATNEIPIQYLDASKAMRTLGWKPLRRMAESLPETVRWYRELLS